MLLKRILIIAGIAIAAVAVACGGSEDPTPTSKPAEATAQPAEEPTATSTPVVIPTIEPIQSTPTPAPAQPTATPRPTATPLPTGPTGELAVGVALITPGNFLPSKIPWPGNLNIISWGVGEGLVRTEYAPPPAEGPLSDQGIAPSWEIAPDLSKITFKIREGVEFHDGWGELTAHDVAFSFNETQIDGSTWARIEMGDFMSESVAVDDRTLEFQFQKWSALWYQWMYQNTGAVPMVSKKAFDDLGYDEAVLTPVFTGPFSVDEWKANDIVQLSAVRDHWRQTPNVESVKIVEIPEVAARLAAFKTGEIHITELPTNFLREAIEATNGRFQQIGNPQSKHVAYAGNYWMKTDHTTGENIFPRPGLNADDDHPWIGNPDDPANMERARLIRHAMARAIDRDLINTEVLDGFGSAQYTWYGFDKGTNPEFKDEWIIPYDPEGAKQTIAEQGFPDGFKVPFYLPPDVPAIVSVEIGEAIAQMWRNIGLDVEIENTAYQARRPTMVDRSIDVVWMWVSNAAVGQVDRAHSHGVIPSKGWNRGMELPWVLEIWEQVDGEDDQAKRIALNVEAEDLANHWMVVAPVVGVSNLWAVSSEVLEWTPFTEGAGYAGTFESVVLK